MRSDMGGTLSQLLEKYDVAGPRYTSYPTVPYWQEIPTADTWVALLQTEHQRMRGLGGGAALYLHLPFCAALCTFCACNRIVTKKTNRNQPYIETLLAEWALYEDILGSKPDVSEIHLGGGTPTFFSAAELKELLGRLLARVTLLPEAELSLEADPRVTTPEHLKVLVDLGFRRISLGIQDYNPEVQRAINRIQSVQMVSDLIENAREMGFQGINFDLVYGLPHQTLASVTATIESVITQQPDRIAFYGYAHVPWVGKTGQRGFDEHDLPSGEAKRALYEHGRDMLLCAGYKEIGMDHFALPHDPLCQAAEQGTLFRNFMGYVPHQVSPLIGLGVSSISDAWGAFIQNEKDLDLYEQRVQRGELPIHRGHVLSNEDLLLRQCILDLMTRFQVNLAPLPPALAVGCQMLLEEAHKDGLVELTEDTVRVTEQGKPFIRNICMAFDARLQAKRPETQIFSRTI